MRALLALMLGCADPLGADTAAKDAGDDAPPVLVLGAPEVDFGVLAYGALETRLLSLTNTGGSALVLDPITVDAPFGVTPADLTLQPAATAQLTLDVQLDTYGAQAAILHLTTNDPAMTTVALPVYAELDADADDDGHDTIAAGGDDCDDADASVHPDATDAWYDNLDADCAGNDDADQDGDGWPAETDFSHPAEPDCADTNPDVHPGADDPPYDGVDTNCDDADDYDADGDGVRAEGWGDDCDDADAEIQPGATELPDGADNDCDGTTDEDTAFLDAGRVWEPDGFHDRAGYASLLADLDGDGLAELIVGAPYHGASSVTANGPGAFAVFPGAADLDPTGTRIEDVTLVSGAGAEDLLGVALTTPGDWDGDGRDDLVVAAGNGMVYVLGGTRYGSGVGDALHTLQGRDGEGLGATLATRVDLDGDGLGELVATWSGDDADGISLTYGGTSGIADADARWSLDSGRVATPGPVGADLDGDGRDDLVIAAASATADLREGAGAVWILAGSASAWTGTDAGIADGAWRLALAGSAVDDGVADALQTGPDWDGNGRDELWVFDDEDGLFVVDGGAAVGVDPKDVATASWSWGAADDPIGRFVRAGDWDGDGVGDMAAWFDDGAGRLAVFGTTRRSGSGDWADERIAWVSGSTVDGNSAAGVGTAPEGADVDGDGDDDLLTGDPGFGANAGEIYVFLQR